MSVRQLRCGITGLFRRIEVMLPGVQHPDNRAKACVELIHRRRGQRQPDGVRCMAGRDGEGGGWRQRDVASSCGRHETLGAPVRGQGQPEVKAFFVGLDFEAREPTDRELLTRARVDASQFRQFGNGAIAHHPLRGCKGVS